MKEDIHIKVLRCVHNHPDGITISEIEAKLNLDPDTLRWVNEECDTGGKKFWRKGRADNNQWIIQLSMEGRAILLEHDELSHARKSSKQATWLAFGALVVAIVVGIVQITSDSNLNEDQLNRILEKEQNLNEVNLKLEQIHLEVASKDSLLMKIQQELEEIKDISNN